MIATRERMVLGLFGLAVGLLIAGGFGSPSLPQAQGQSAPGHDSGWLMATGRDAL
jgi:hypothetical protein